MNKRVATDAWRDLRRSSAHRVNRAGGDRAMALVAQRVDVRHVQQPGVLRAMRSVAPQAALRLDRSVLVHEWPAGLGVALGADRILIGSRLQVVVPEGAVNVVAVAAFDQPFVHLVVKRHIERRLGVSVALKTEHWLWRLQQRLLLAAVDVVAAEAAHAGFGMRGSNEVGM